MQFDIRTYANIHDTVTIIHIQHLPEFPLPPSLYVFVIQIQHKIYFLRNFEGHNTVLLIIGIMLYRSSLEFSHLA